MQRRGRGARPAHTCDPSAPRGAPQGPNHPPRTAGPSRSWPSSGRSGQRPSLTYLWSPRQGEQVGVRDHRQDPAFPGWECLQIRVQKRGLFDVVILRFSILTVQSSWLQTGKKKSQKLSAQAPDFCDLPCAEHIISPPESF